MAVGGDGLSSGARGNSPGRAVINGPRRVRLPLCGICREHVLDRYHAVGALYGSVCLAARAQINPFGKGMNQVIPSAILQYCNTAILQYRNTRLRTNSTGSGSSFHYFRLRIAKDDRRRPTSAGFKIDKGAAVGCVRSRRIVTLLSGASFAASSMENRLWQVGTVLDVTIGLGAGGNRNLRALAGGEPRGQ